MRCLQLGVLLLLVPMLGMAAQECSSTMSKTAPNVRYQFNANGTVSDRSTGLTWMRCPLGKTWSSTEQRCEGEGQAMFWQAALNDVQAINNSPNHALYHFADKANWRMPNIKELVTLAERSCRNPALNGKAFANAFPYSTNQESYGAGDIRAYVWSNTHVQLSSEIFTFDVRNAEIISFGPTVIQGSVLLVSDN
ncbi:MULTISPECIES: DUF1566 domain-containing protein [unclassified Agarivorans]|uniref:Lcl C-terminal domain-containing protein n=1 Tax=unclassified Agarivorans TaxID=2636026 RepID=UPI003D7C55B0